MTEELTTIEFSEPKPKRKPKRIAVKVISSAHGTALVEWVDKTRLGRGYLPDNLIDDGTVTDDNLDIAAPYGVPWEDVITLAATPEKIANALRGNGIWTLADLSTNPRGAIGALQATYRVDLAALLQAARNYEKGV